MFNVILAMGISTSPGKKGVLYPEKIGMFNVILAMGLSTSPGKKGVLYPELLGKNKKCSM